MAKDGSEAETPEGCESCAYDWSDYGAASCDAAWDAFGLDCATLEANYGWNCLGCACPGDNTDTCDEGYDCAGECGGSAVEDCSGACGGDAFTD